MLQIGRAVSARDRASLEALVDAPGLPDVRFNGGKSFTELHAPKPPEPPHLFAVQEAPPVRERPDLLSRYLGDDLRAIILDSTSRPDHYTEAQKNALVQLSRGEKVPSSVRSDLLLQFTRRSEPQKLERRMRRERSEAEQWALEALPAFEDQKLFEGAIRWG